MTYEEVSALVGRPYRQVAREERICGVASVVGSQIYVWRVGRMLRSAAFLDGRLVTHATATLGVDMPKSADGLPIC